MVVNINGKDFNEDQVQALVDAGLLGAGQKNDLNNTNFQTQAAHGFWSDGTTPGLFTRPFSERGALSAVRYPDARIIARLWRGVTDTVATEYDIITGVDAGRGSNASDWCDEAPRAGFARLATTRAAFGEFHMQTDSVKLANIGGRINRGDVDQTVINMPEAFPLTPDFLGGLMGGDAINTALGLEVFRFSVHAARVFTRVLFHGSRANTGNNALLGFQREFDGYDQIIKTGYTDLETGQFVPAVDSIVEDFNNVNISAGSSNVVELLSSILYQLDQRTDENNFGQEWNGTIYMEPDMFFAITERWPCSYLTNGCTTSGSDGTRLVVGGAEQVAMRDQMRTGRYLWILGRQVRVETTRAIERTAEGPGFTSSIYFINESVPGLAQTTFLEGFNMGNADIAQYTRHLPNGEIAVTNGGFYLSTFNRESTCLEYVFQAKPRLIHRAPWLCARIENLVYTLPGYGDDVYPSEPYYRNGGRYVSTGGYTVYSGS